MKLQFGHVEVFVKDPLKSKDFYINILGFELIEVQSDKYIWLKLGDREILLRPGFKNHSSPTYQSTNMAFVIFTDDLNETIKIYKERGLVFNGDDGNCCPTFTDLDGNWFQLVNPKHI